MKLSEVKLRGYVLGAVFETAAFRGGRTLLDEKSGQTPLSLRQKATDPPELQWVGQRIKLTADARSLERQLQSELN